MKPKNLLLILVLLTAAVALSGCGGNAFAASSWPSILVADEISYVAYNQYVYAINVEDGQMRWQYPESGEQAKTFYAQPTLTEDGQLIIGSFNGSLYSLNPQTGAENWVFSQSTGRYIGAALAHGDRIYAPSANHRLYALDLSGNEVWRFEESRGPLWAKPLMDEERQMIYLPSMDHHLYAIDRNDGELIWEANLNGSIVGTPVLEDGVLYVGSFANSMNAVNADSGAILWSTPVSNWVWAGPALHEGRLYFGDLGGSLYSLEAESGTIVWQSPPDGPVTATPYIAEQTIYFTSEEGVLKALNLDGTQQWSQPVGGKIYASPTPADDLILVSPINTDPLVIGVNLNGTQRWSFVPPS